MGFLNVAYICILLTAELKAHYTSPSAKSYSAAEINTSPFLMSNGTF